MDGKVCCVTGHRPKGFPFPYSGGESKRKYLADMRAIIEKLIDGGYRLFVSGGALGADSDFAETVLGLKETHPDISLEIAVPCVNQNGGWTAGDKSRYSEILARADKITHVSDVYSAGCMQKRNRYMVDESDLVLAFRNGNTRGGTYNTVKYAQSTGKEIITYDLKTLEFKEGDIQLKFTL